MHYYKKNIGDYHKKAGRLSILEHGAYTLLLDACYDRERFPTEDEAIEWAWARSTEEKEAVRFVLSRFFVLRDGVYVQDRVQEEIDKYHQNAETNARIAKEREEKRRMQNASSTNREHSVNEAPPNHKPLTINQEPLTTKESADKSAVSRLKVLRTYLDECKEQGVKPLPDDHYIRAYAEDSGITLEMLGLCWVRFVEEHTEGARKAKKYKDWTQAFANAVKDNWFKFWYVRDGEVCLSSQGEIFRAAYQAKKEGGN